MTPTPGSYDDHQLAAQLIRCAGCGRSYYMTTVREQCLECEPWEVKPEAVDSAHTAVRVLLPADRKRSSMPSIAQTDLAGRVLHE